MTDREEEIRGFKARRVAGQDNPGGRLHSRFCLKGGIAMGKTVLKYVGHTAALVAISWFLLLVGQFTELQLVSIPILAIARVLP